MSISNGRKRVIHVAKQQLAMADEDYRALLRHAAGVESSAALDDAGFAAVMAEFERLGFRNVKRPLAPTRPSGMATATQIGRTRALWKAYTGDDDERALGRWLEKHFHTSDVRFLEAWRASKAVAVLEKMAAWRRSHPREQQPRERAR